MKKIICVFTLICGFQVSANAPHPKPASEKSTLLISREDLLDHIYGGWVGMIIGGLEGLPHEFKYNEELYRIKLQNPEVIETLSN